MPTQTSTRVKLDLTLPESIHDALAERALKLGRSTQAEIVARLQHCITHVSTNPIYVTDAGRNELSTIAGQLIQTEAELINWAKRMVKINVAGTEITLDERLLSRLASRTFGHSLEDTIRKYVIEGLESAVGMR